MQCSCLFGECPNVWLLSCLIQNANGDSDIVWISGLRPHKAGQVPQHVRAAGGLQSHGHQETGDYRQRNAIESMVLKRGR